MNRITSRSIDIADDFLFSCDRLRTANAYIRRKKKQNKFATNHKSVSILMCKQAKFVLFPIIPYVLRKQMKKTYLFDWTYWYTGEICSDVFVVRRDALTSNGKSLFEIYCTKHSGHASWRLSISFEMVPLKMCCMHWQTHAIFHSHYWIIWSERTTRTA